MSWAEDAIGELAALHQLEPLCPDQRRRREQLVGELVVWVADGNPPPADSATPAWADWVLPRLIGT